MSTILAFDLGKIQQSFLAMFTKLCDLQVAAQNEVFHPSEPDRQIGYQA